MIEMIKKVIKIRKSFSINTLLKYTCVEDYILERGKEPKYNEVINAEQYLYLMSLVRKSKIQNFRIGNCHLNATELLRVDDEQRLQYIEGFAASNDNFYYHHAWLELDGYTIDVTWRHENGKFYIKEDVENNLADIVMGKIPPNWKYLGVVLNREFVLEQNSDYTSTRLLLGSHTHNFTFLKQDRIN